MRQPTRGKVCLNWGLILGIVFCLAVWAGVWLLAVG